MCDEILQGLSQQQKIQGFPELHYTETQRCKTVIHAC